MEADTDDLLPFILDLLIQSKSGTGKTCVFTVLALEEVDISKRCIQVVILNPVRELAIQNADVAMEIGCRMPGNISRDCSRASILSVIL